MMITILAIILYVLIGIFTYKKFIYKWDNPKFEKIWFSCLWITLLPLYIIRKLQGLQ